LAGIHTSVLQDADGTVITAVKVYKRRIIKDYQIATRCAATGTKILF
jgi:hypothetical protein